MKLAENKLQEGAQLLQCSTAGVIHEKFLQKYINEDHWASLHSVMNNDDFYTPGKGKISIIVEWLGLGSSYFIQRVDPAGAANQLELEEVDVEEPEEEKLVDIQEEADIIQDERMLDDEDEEEAARHRKRKAKMEEHNEIADLLLAMSLKNDSQEPQETEGNW
ncbi:hypothetical protein AB205_0162460, partial [Aquarana catesbeiana]